MTPNDNKPSASRRKRAALPDLRQTAERAVCPVLLQALRRRRPPSLAEGELRHPRRERPEGA